MQRLYILVWLWKSVSFDFLLIENHCHKRMTSLLDQPHNYCYNLGDWANETKLNKSQGDPCYQTSWGVDERYLYRAEP